MRKLKNKPFPLNTSILNKIIPKDVKRVVPFNFLLEIVFPYNTQETMLNKSPGCKCFFRFYDRQNILCFHIYFLVVKASVC